MITAANRGNYRTLFNHNTVLWSAAERTDEDAEKPVIIYIASDAEPIIVTRNDFQDALGRYAYAMLTLGENAVRRDDLIIIAHTQNLESIFAFCAAMWIGAIPSMFPTLTEKLDPDIYMRNMAELVSRSNVRAIFTNDEFAPTLAPHVPCPVISSAQLQRAPHEVLATDTPGRALLGKLVVQTRAFGDYMDEHGNWGNQLFDVSAMPDRVAFLQHSSGTTGLQKGVAITHEALLNQIASYSDALHLSHDDVIASWLPLYHDMGLIAGFLLPIIQGIPLVLMSPFDWVSHPALLLRAIHDYKATFCWLPNFAYNHMAKRVRPRDSDGLDLTSIRALVNCSEPVRADSHTAFVERFAANGVSAKQLTVSYAMAENTFAVTQTPVNEPAPVIHIDREQLAREGIAVLVEADSPRAAAHVSCGKPIAHVQVRVVDANGLPIADGHVGELRVKSDSVLQSYYQRPDLQPFDDQDWYITGDRGFLLHSEVFIVGRSKDLIISAGKNVYPQDIEAVLYTIPGIHPGRAVVFGVPDEEEGTELIAIVAEVDTDDAGEKKRINAALRQQVSKATEITVSYVTLVERGWLIKTSSGKTARAANREKWLATRTQA